MPQLDPDVLDAYQPRPAKIGHTYSIGDHPYIAAGAMRELFEALRQAVLALDPCVSEEFLKLYVAYKAETNFVDVVPQAKRLRLSLNMPFHAIDDPEDFAKTYPAWAAGATATWSSACRHSMTCPMCWG
jgi:hypothetical protein